jgi:hypothetical protein
MRPTAAPCPSLSRAESKTEPGGEPAGKAIGNAKNRNREHGARRRSCERKSKAPWHSDAGKTEERRTCKERFRRSTPVRLRSQRLESGEKNNAIGKTQPLPDGGGAVSERSRSTHGAPAGENCRKKNKRRRRAVDRTLTHEEDTGGGAIRDEKAGASKNAAQKGARHSAVAARFGGDKTHNPSARRVRRAGPQYA